MFTHNKPLDKHAAVMILHELLGKPHYVPPKLKPQKAPTLETRKPDEPASTGAALDRVRKQLSRDVLKLKKPSIESEKHR